MHHRAGPWFFHGEEDIARDDFALLDGRRRVRALPPGLIHEFYGDGGDAGGNGDADDGWGNAFNEIGGYLDSAMDAEFGGGWNDDDYNAFFGMYDENAPEFEFDPDPDPDFDVDPDAPAPNANEASGAGLPGLAGLVSSGLSGLTGEESEQNAAAANAAAAAAAEAGAPAFDGDWTGLANSVTQSANNLAALSADWAADYGSLADESYNAAPSFNNTYQDTMAGFAPPSADPASVASAPGAFTGDLSSLANSFTQSANNLAALSSTWADDYADFLGEKNTERADPNLPFSEPLAISPTILGAPPAVSDPVADQIGRMALENAGLLGAEMSFSPRSDPVSTADAPNASPASAFNGDWTGLANSFTQSANNLAALSADWADDAVASAPTSLSELQAALAANRDEYGRVNTDIANRAAEISADRASLAPVDEALSRNDLSRTAALLADADRALTTPLDLALDAPPANPFGQLSYDDIARAELSFDDYARMFDPAPAVPDAPAETSAAPNWSALADDVAKTASQLTALSSDWATDYADFLGESAKNTTRADPNAPLNEPFTPAPTILGAPPPSRDPIADQIERMALENPGLLGRDMTFTEAPAPASAPTAASPSAPNSSTNWSALADDVSRTANQLAALSADWATDYAFDSRDQLSRAPVVAQMPDEPRSLTIPGRAPQAPFADNLPTLDEVIAATRDARAPAAPAPAPTAEPRSLTIPASGPPQADRDPSMDATQVGPRTSGPDFKQLVNPSTIFNIPLGFIPGFWPLNTLTRLVTGRDILTNLFPDARGMLPEEFGDPFAASGNGAPRLPTQSSPAPVVAGSPYNYSPPTANPAWMRVYRPLTSDPRRYGFGSEHTFFEDNRGKVA
jgi:hypothetical protein